MNGLMPMMQTAVQREHDERVQKGLERQLFRALREERGEMRSVRGRIGRFVMRAGARLVPEREIVFDRQNQISG